jgi:thiol-disulfide isomerase/thioredoxin
MRTLRRSFTALAELALLAAGGLCADLPRRAPELKFPLADGQDFVLSSLRGKVVALEFLFTTCPHCQDLSRTTGRLLREYEVRGFRAIGVACNPEAELLVAEFVKRFDVAYPVGIGNAEMMFSYLGPQAKPFRLPVLFFIDRKGMIRAQFTGEDSFFAKEDANMRAMIEKLLKEPEAQGAKH